MIKDHQIPSMGQFILRRYEHNLNKGTIILFDTKTFEVWFGNDAAYDLIKYIDGKTSMKDIYEKMLPLYKDYPLDEVKNSFETVLSYLIEKNFIYIKN